VTHSAWPNRRNETVISMTDKTAGVSRRNFAALAGGAAGLAVFAPLRRAFAAERAEASAGKAWAGWNPGEFQVHFIYTGVAESLFAIFPDATTMLIDCGDHAAVTRLDLAVPVMPNPGRLAGDWIGRYVRRANPNREWVDYLVTSHFHQDHTGTPCWQTRRVQAKGEARTGCWRSGFGLAVEHLRFRKAIDRGWPTYDDPIPFVDSDTRPLAHMKRVYEFLAKRDGLTVEKFRLGASDQFVPLHDAAAVQGFSVRNICANGRIAYPDGRIRDVCAESGVYKNVKSHGSIENMLSLGMVFSYGRFRFYTAGDFSGPPEFPEVEKAIGAAAGRVDVAKINHHGHHSMPFECVRDLAARVYVACVWDQLHVTEDTMTRLADRNAYPGDRLICPGVMAEERRKAEGDRPWMKDVPEAVCEPSHVVLTVPRGGVDYSVSFLDARDEEMRVKGVMRFQSHERKQGT